MDLSYPEWKEVGYTDVDKWGFSEEQWRQANPPINELRAKEGLPPYDDGVIPTPETGS
jgi:hypothetical protein